MVQKKGIDMPDPESLQSLAKTVEYMRSRLDMIVEAIIGDPTDKQKPGVLIRLDRLEQSRISQAKIQFALIGGLISVAGTVIAAIILRFI